MTPPLSADEPRTPAQLLAMHAARQPGETFLVTGSERVSWQAMWQRTERVAGGLLRLHVGPGDTVILAMGNRIEFLETWFAVASIGGIEVPLNPGLMGARLLFLLNHSRARVAVVEPEVAARIDELAPELDHLQHVVVVEGAAPAAIPSSAFADLRAADGHSGTAYAGDESQLSAILYTSGSTGPPKGVRPPPASALRMCCTFACRFTTTWLRDTVFCLR
jgi:acyl-CoA synthetase (AMP-forming)/AMP-acid ligase II